MKKILFILGFILILASCQIVEEYTFNENGSGTYEMVFDMSELSGMASELDSAETRQPVDTTLVFADLLEEKKDSISQLNEEEQAKLELLRPMKVSMKMNEASGEMVMRIHYAFEDVTALKDLGKALEAAELEELNDAIMGNTAQVADSTQEGKEQPLFDMVSSFDMNFNARKFSRTITAEAREKQLREKDTTLTQDDPFADMIRYKQIFNFPYRVKEVNNPKARILSDFKGVEIEANLFEMNDNPDFFNLEVLFEK